MDSTEFESLINDLDQKIETARREAESRAKRDALERPLKLLNGRIETLRPRIAEAARLGLDTSHEAGVLAGFERERDELMRRLAELPSAAPVHAAPVPAVSPEPARPLSDEEHRALQAIDEEILLADVPHQTPEIRWALFEVWALRWRQWAETVGQDRVDRAGRATFRAIREHMERHPEGRFYIACLSVQNHGDWTALHERALARLHELQQAEARRLEVEVQIQELMSIREAAASDEKALRRVRHLARDIGRHPEYREELADACRPFRPLLGAEFDFLFDTPEEEPEPEAAKKHLARREVMVRILRRLFNKANIGACHAPVDRVVKGFAGHDLSHAKEAVDILRAAGILRIKSTAIGKRVSIEPSQLEAVKAGLAGSATGVARVDAWAAAEPQSADVTAG